MQRFIEWARSSPLYRELCRIPGTGDGNLLERTDPLVAEAQTQFLAWALALANPQLVLEVGTDKGLFPYFMSLLLDGVEVHTVDVRKEACQAVDLLNTRQGAVHCVFHEGDSREILPRLDVRPDFAWLDGGLETDVVLSDLLQCYRLRVPYVAVDDTAYPSVRQAVEYAMTHLTCELVPNPFMANDRRQAVLMQLQPGPAATA
jgi:hypothetical protein